MGVLARVSIQLTTRQEDWEGGPPPTIERYIEMHQDADPTNFVEAMRAKFAAELDSALVKLVNYGDEE